MDEAMTNEELVALIQSGVDVENNMAELYQQNRNFIYKIAASYSKICDVDDLMQEAYFGLDKAVKGFKQEQEFMFLTYAEFKIRQSIQRYCYNCGKVKRYPVYIITLMSKYHKFSNDYLTKHDVAPTADVIILGLGISKKQLKMIEKCIYEFSCQSIDDIIPGTDEITLGEVVSDEYDLEDDVTERVCTEQNNAALWQLVDELDNRQAMIVKCRYKQNMSLAEVAEQEGISGERIRQIERKAFISLKKKNKIREIALFYGYDCSKSYQGSFQRFKNTRTSSTEFVALKRLEIEQRLAAVDEMINWL